MAIDLQEMKRRLREKEEELKTQMRGLTEAYPDPEQANDDVQDMEENAVDATEQQQEQSLLVNQQALLTEVRAALKRIENGTYGICTECGEPIPEKRLEAIPWAARCVKDEELLEQRNLSREELYDSETT